MRKAKTRNVRYTQTEKQFNHCPTLLSLYIPASTNHPTPLVRYPCAAKQHGPADREWHDAQKKQQRKQWQCQQSGAAQPRSDASASAAQLPVPPTATTSVATAASHATAAGALRGTGGDASRWARWRRCGGRAIGPTDLTGLQRR